MDISSILGFSQDYLYKTSGKQTTVSAGSMFGYNIKEKDDQAKSAERQKAEQKISGIAASDSTTANTLWQTQNIAQSPESEAIDVEAEAEDIKVKPQTAAEKFLEFMNKTPEELMREAILKELGYTEEDIAAMDPKERAKVEAKIQELVEMKIEQALREDGVDIDVAKKSMVSPSVTALL